MAEAPQYSVDPSLSVNIAPFSPLVTSSELCSPVQQFFQGDKLTDIFHIISFNLLALIKRQLYYFIHVAAVCDRLFSQKPAYCPQGQGQEGPCKRLLTIKELR